MKQATEYYKDYQYVHGGGLFEGPQRYTSEEDNILSIISNQCLYLNHAVVWFDGLSLPKITGDMKNIDRDHYSRVIVIESMPHRKEGSIPHDLEKILEDNGFKIYKDKR